MPASMPIRGEFGHEYFDYVEIKVKGCELGPQCLPDAKVIETGFNFRA